MSWGWRSWRSGSNPVRQAWCVGWLIRTSGVIGVVRGRSSGGWFMSCSGGGRRRCPGWDRAGQVARHGRGPLQSLVQSVAGTAPQGAVRWGRGGHDGRIHRVHDRRQRGTPNRDGSDGPVPCRPPCPGRPGPMPAPRPTRTPRARQLPPQNAPHCRRTPPQR